MRDAGDVRPAGSRRFPLDECGGIAIGVRSRGVGAWIPACAGMTKWGRGNDEVGARE